MPKCILEFGIGHDYNMPDLRASTLVGLGKELFALSCMMVTIVHANLPIALLKLTYIKGYAWALALLHI